MCAVDLGVETLAAFGLEKAKEVIAAKFGQSVLAAILPYLSAMGWTVLAVEFISLLSNSAFKSILESAVSKNTGVVYYQVGVNNNTVTAWHLWDGSSGFGPYPSARIPSNPNAVYYGELRINLTSSY